MTPNFIMLIYPNRESSMARLAIACTPGLDRLLTRAVLCRSFAVEICPFGAWLPLGPRRFLSSTRYKITVYARFIPLCGGFMKAMGLIGLRVVSAAAVILIAQNTSAAADWPDWRGPNRDGTSREKGLPEKWSLKGGNLAWK